MFSLPILKCCAQAPHHGRRIRPTGHLSRGRPSSAGCRPPTVLLPVRPEPPRRFLTRSQNLCPPRAAHSLPGHARYPSLSSACCRATSAAGVRLPSPAQSPARRLPSGSRTVKTLSELTGLTRLGVHLCRILPGKEGFAITATTARKSGSSSFPVASPRSATRNEIGPGDFLGYPAGGAAHHLKTARRRSGLPDGRRALQRRGRRDFPARR